MIYCTYIPRSPLSQFVEFFWFREGYNVPKAQARLLPTGSMELVINLRENSIPLFDRSSRVQYGNARGSMICGPHSKSFIVNVNSEVCVMGVHFKPGGGIPFFAVPAKELHNQILSLDELWNHLAIALRDRLLEASTIKTRFLVLEQFFLSLIQLPEHHAAVDFALQQFERSHTSTIATVTQQIGFSARHFNQLFRDRVGLTPKVFCRVQRLRQVLNLLSESSVDWIDIALSCGYFDQAHFIHDFRSFADCTPTDYLKYRGLHPQHIVLPN
ncbi:helix-turn-helix transcriptional regulator [Gloeocapsopsis crepidinum LEGE 06123]|uniref:Helix-turn-helix transcriptional regulator n=1 Tax=Gloeocapsopsis crepidinum LEGE 06123 TaxID=588587 RepID=A0ABR9UYB0_9CHRO|nr:helix-turn-helix transcriptional regulator [Gloeocapsopsis crepidinum]MBE9193289.1 helix-turn-helix transcriptional regulator [Gloeocapsopsis crepidinum LEGE 06123]